MCKPSWKCNQWLYCTDGSIKLEEGELEINTAVKLCGSGL